MIFPDLNVAENIFISHRNRGWIVNWRKMYRDAEEILQRLDISLDVRSPAQGVTFELKAGEALGFSGLVGSGRTNVGLALFGITPADRGTITYNGQPTTIRTPQQAVNLGIAYVTEDRRGLGLSRPMSIQSNITLPFTLGTLGGGGVSNHLGKLECRFS